MHTIFRFWLRNDKKTINKPLKALLFISGLFMFAFGMFSPIYALFVERIGGDITTASNAWAVFLMTAGVLTFLTGKFENKLKETELAIAWSQVVIGLAYVMYCFTEEAAMLYLTQMVMGIGAAIFWPAFHSIYGKHTDGDQAAWQWSFYDALAYIVPAASAVIGGVLVKTYGFDMIFVIMAGLSFINAVFIWLLPRKVL